MPAYIRKYRVYQNSRPKKSISCQNNEYRHGAFYSGPWCTVLFTVPLIRRRTVHWLPIPKARTACSFTRGDAFSPREGLEGELACSLPRSPCLPHQQNKNRSRTRISVRGTCSGERGKGKPWGQRGADRKTTSPTDWLGIRSVRGRFYPTRRWEEGVRCGAGGRMS